MLLKTLTSTVLFLHCCFANNVFISKYVFEWGAKDPTIVEKYLRSSISNPVSSYILGTLYLTGTILKKDLQKADWYITKAANMNLPEAINSIGDAYYSGDIRPRNIEKALENYQRAADLGFGPAQFNAGVVLIKTAKNQKDLKRAIFYLDKASKNHDDLGEVAKVAKRYKLSAKIKLRSYK